MVGIATLVQRWVELEYEGEGDNNVLPTDTIMSIYAQKVWQCMVITYHKCAILQGNCCGNDGAQWPVAIKLDVCTGETSKMHSSILDHLLHLVVQRCMVWCCQVTFSFATSLSFSGMLEDTPFGPLSFPV